jgi:threonine/homoserine/homoserine lactone efflux protein
MEDQPVKRSSPFWRSNVPGLLALLLGPVLIGVFVTLLMPLMRHLTRVDLWVMFGMALLSGVVGVGVLVLVKWLAYRQEKYSVYEPQAFAAAQRRLSRWAYTVTGLSVLLLLVLWFLLRIRW